MTEKRHIPDWEPGYWRFVNLLRKTVGIVWVVLSSFGTCWSIYAYFTTNDEISPDDAPSLAIIFAMGVVLGACILKAPSLPWGRRGRKATGDHVPQAGKGEPCRNDPLQPEDRHDIHNHDKQLPIQQAGTDQRERPR